MRFLLLHGGKDQKTAERLRETLKSRNVEASVFFTGEEDAGFGALLEGTLSGVSHILLISSVPAFFPWLAFIAGYSRALELPLLLYGGGPEDWEPGFSKYWIPIKNETALVHYIEVELPAYISREGRARAKYELLESGIPFNEEAFANSVIGGDEKAVSLFIVAGFSPNVQDRFGVPLLNLAARAGNRNIVNILLKAGARVDQQTEDRLSSALIDAVSGKFHGIMQDLLAAGADVNLKSRDGQSALILAVGLSDEFSAELLLKAGAHADEPDSLGASGRKYATLFNKPAMVALFNTYAPQKSVE
jgi:hypothetical protein